MNRDRQFRQSKSLFFSSQKSNQCNPNNLSPVIMMMQTAENGASVNLTVGRIIGRSQRLVVHGGMRAQGVVVADKLLDQIFQMNFPENKKVIQAFPADGGNPAFSVGVHVGGTERNFEDTQSFLFKEPIKRFTKFRVTVADQNGFAGGGQIFGYRFKLVKNSLLVGAFGDAGNINPAGFDVDEKEDVESLFAEDRPDGLGKKVAGPEGIEGAFEIVGEGILRADAGRRDTVFNQDILNSGFADRDFEFFKFGKDFGIAPFGTAGHGDDEDADVVGKNAGAAASFGRRFRQMKVTHPAAESGVMDDGENLFDSAAQGHAEFE